MNSFSDLLKKLLEESKETNRCRVKADRMDSDNPYYKEYWRFVEDGNKSIANITNSLFNGNYIAKSKREELSAIEEVKKRVKSHRWKAINPQNSENVEAIEKKQLLDFLETLENKINSGEQAKIEKVFGKQRKTNKNEENQELHDEWQRIVDEIYPLSQKEHLTKEDYNQIKKLQKQTNDLSQKIKKDPILESLVEDCLNTLKELEREYKSYSPITKPSDTKKDQIQSKIRDLENKPNKTSEEEQELAKKKKQLEELEKNTEPSSKEPFNWQPWAIGGIVLLVLGIGFYYAKKKSKQKKK